MRTLDSGKWVLKQYFLALHEFLWDSYLKLSLIFNWNAPSDPRCEDFFAGIVLAAIERASLG